MLEKLSSNNDDDDDQKNNSSRRGKRFHEERFLPPHLRSRNGHYRNSGFDRGHLAPAANARFYAAAADDDDESKFRSTFSLCNVSPQVASFNRREWARLEALVRRVHLNHQQDQRRRRRSDGDDDDEIFDRDTFVVTGPLWLPSPDVAVVPKDATNETRIEKKFFRHRHTAFGDPPSLVSVPTHFFKVVAVIRKRRRRRSSSTGDDDGDDWTTEMEKFAAFVLPNVESRRDDAHPPPSLVRSLVRLEALEAVSGLQFFPGLWDDNDDHDHNDFSNSAVVVTQGTDVSRPREATFCAGKKLMDSLTEEVFTDHERSASSSSFASKEVNKTSDSSSLLVSSTSTAGKKRHKILNELRGRNTSNLSHLCRNNYCG